MNLWSLALMPRVHPGGASCERISSGDLMGFWGEAKPLAQ